MTEGDALTLTGLSKNLEPGETLYWNLNSQISNATLEDFKNSTSKRKARATTIANDGTFEISIQSIQDKLKENNEKFQVELFQTPAELQVIARTKSITLIDTKREVKAKDGTKDKPHDQSNNKGTPELDLMLNSLVLPARLSGRLIPIKELIDFSEQDEKNNLHPHKLQRWRLL